MERATPTLYGKDAQEVLDQIKKKPSEDQKRKAKERSQVFMSIGKKGL